MTRDETDEPKAGKLKSLTELFDAQPGMPTISQRIQSLEDTMKYHQKAIKRLDRTTSLILEDREKAAKLENRVERLETHLFQAQMLESLAKATGRLRIKA